MKIPEQDTVEELCKVALHEVVHLVSFQLTGVGNRLKLLDEGIAVYLSKQYEGKIFTIWVNDYFRKELPRISDFCTYSNVEFANKKGYQHAHMIIEFLLETYGRECFLDWLKNSEKFMERIQEIDEKFNDYIVEKIETRIK